MWVQTYRPPMIFGAQLLKQTLMELRQWLAVFAPSLLVTLAGLTVFREAIWRSIASSAHPSLVYLILLACLVALVLCAFTLNHYQKEMREVQHWKHKVLVLGQQPDAQPPAGSQRSVVSAALASLTADLPHRQREARFELELAAASTSLSERLAYVNYIAGALIGLGLVGTFVGLLGTLEDLGAVFGSLANTGNASANPTTVFADMVKRLQDPMRAMGTAFVASLYGLMGSLLVGLCALTVSRVGQGITKALRTLARGMATDPRWTQDEPSKAVDAHGDRAWSVQQLGLSLAQVVRCLDQQTQLLAHLTRNGTVRHRRGKSVRSLRTKRRAARKR
jgi:biopolymer transport protein ExbB/TolQ